MFTARVVLGNYPHTIFEVHLTQSFHSFNEALTWLAQFQKPVYGGSVVSAWIKLKVD
jgi:hypothetical protein